MDFPRKLPRLLLAAALPLSFAACAPAADDQIDEFDVPAIEPGETPAPEAPPAGMPMAPATAQFTPLDDSGVTGSIEVQDEGDQTRVVALLSGAEAGGVHRGMIHSGTCEAPGAPVETLSEVTIGEDGTGEGVSSVAVAPATVMDGQHVVIYHEAGGDPGAAIACAAIPAHTM